MKQRKNRKINLLLGLILSLVLFAACTDLTVQEIDSTIVESTEGAATGDPTELLSSAYQDLGTFTDQANIYALGVHPTDEMLPPTRGVDWGDNGVWRTLHAHTWDATHSWILNAWNQLNSRAFKCNQILASNPNSLQAAEAKFLRALYMSYVVDYWGQVPFREANEGADVDPRVMNRTEAFDFIIKDLTEALPDLPATGPSASNPTASKAAANLLLTRMYLNKAVYTASDATGPYSFDAADMNKVIEAADAITADGYSLEPNYFDNWTGDAASEVILSTSEGSPQNRWMMTLHYSQNPSGWNGFTTLADFYAKFEDGDQRKGSPAKADGSEFSGIGLGFLIGQQYDDNGNEVIDSRSQQPLVFTPDVPLAGAATEKGIRAIKYHPATANDYILMRYGEALMNKAEAIMRGGNSSESAVDIINMIREARGAAPVASLGEMDMLDERGRELYWEGFRRSDQIRFGTFTMTWDEKTTTEAHRVLYPIPQQALDSNPNLAQNPGY